SVAITGACLNGTRSDIEDYIVFIGVDYSQYVITWMPGNIHTISAGVTPSIVGNNIYTVTVLDTNTTCSVSVIDTVIGLALPPAPVTHDSIQCGFHVPTCTVTGAGGSFVWYTDSASALPIPGETLDHLTAFTISVTDTFWVAE